jgi:transposase
MFLPSSRVRVFVCLEAVDMRKSFSGLSGAVRGILRQDPLSGHVFCFFNRRRNYVKLLFWDRIGWVIVAKRLCRGTFADVGKKELSLFEVEQLLAGVELGQIRWRKGYEYLPEEQKVLV